MPAALVRFVRFALVGGLSTALYFGVFTGGILLGVPTAVAAVIAFAVSAANGYVLHHRWTFATTSRSNTDLVRWLSLQGSVLLLNVLALTALTELAGLPPIAAQAILLPAIPLLTYVLSGRYIFTQRAAPTAR